MTKILNSKRGFTLTELLVAILIISILTSISIISYNNFIKKSAIANDDLLANRVNNLLEHIKYDKMLDDNTIAIIVQEELGNDVIVESKKYGMNIYYNQEKCSFEVISNKNDNEYTPLDYYLNSITFHINKTYLYESKWEKIETFESTYDFVNISLNDEDLIIAIASDNDNTLKIPHVDLSKIIYTKSTQKNENNLTFELKSIDLRDEDKQISLITDGLLGANELSLPGMYKVTAYAKDYSFTLDLYVKNIYYSKSPDIIVSNTPYTYNVEQNEDNTYDFSLIFTDLFNKIYLKDYNDYHYNEDFMPLSQFEEYGNQYTKNIDIFIEVGNKSQQLSLSSEYKRNFTLSFDEVDLDVNPSIKITYRYQGSTGVYCYYSSEEIIVNKQ